MRRLGTFTFLVAAFLALSACGMLGIGNAEPSACDGISSTVGGCDADRPVFSGTTCDAVAEELGVQLNDQLLEIVNGPERSDESKATRVRHRESLAVSLANNHLREMGLIRDCGVDGFLAVSEQQFSDEFRMVIGQYAWDGPRHGTYEEWLDQLREYLQVIDMDESA